MLLLSGLWPVAEMLALLYGISEAARSNMPGRHAHFNATIFQKLIIAPYEVDNIRTHCYGSNQNFFLENGFLSYDTEL